jgi:hypothetical protein
MSSSEIIAISSLISAGDAQSRASEAKRIACKSYLNTFDGKNSDINSQKQYAECVQLIYPPQKSEVDTTGLKVLFVLGLIGMVYSFFWAKKDFLAKDDWILIFFSSLLGFVIFPIIALVLCFFIIGMIWLFGG